MNETHRFRVPDYFPEFSCKMGACRTPCCMGWPVTISMRNYHQLVGLDCSPLLRRRLDCSLHLLPNPTEDAYASIEHRYDGDCGVRAEDGRCLIHMEQGEDALSDVCCLYPRGVRMGQDGYECSCANSCEAVIEHLYRRKAPLTFLDAPFTLRIPEHLKRPDRFPVFGMEWELRSLCFRVIQDDSMPLAGRLSVLGELLAHTDAAFREANAAAVRTLLDAPLPSPVFTAREIGEEELERGLDTAARFLALVDERSDSVREYGERAIRWFHTDENGVSLERYHLARQRFASAFPDWERFFSAMLVNHMFFSQFPFQDRPDSMVEEFDALCCVYGMLRFLSLGVMAEGPDVTLETDLCAAAFRLIEHTSFDRIAGKMLRSIGRNTQEAMLSFIRL